MADIPPIIVPDDLDPFANIPDDKAQAMIDDGLALAARVAPCILTDQLSDADRAAVKAILRNAILRWNEAGTGALSGLQQSAGSFQVSQTLDSRSPRRTLLWPSEISDLQDICKGTSSSNAFSINTVPVDRAVVHADICSINFGSEWCSCGAIITGRLPLYEQGW